MAARQRASAPLRRVIDVTPVRLPLGSRETEATRPAADSGRRPELSGDDPGSSWSLPLPRSPASGRLASDDNRPSRRIRLGRRCWHSRSALAVGPAVLNRDGARLPHSRIGSVLAGTRCTSATLMQAAGIGPPPPTARWPAARRLPRPRPERPRQPPPTPPSSVMNLRRCAPDVAVDTGDPLSMDLFD